MGSQARVQDSRLRAVGWAAIAAEVSDGRLKEVGSLSGLLLPPASVPEGEGEAIAQTLAHSQGSFDFTADCKPALRCLCASFGKKTPLVSQKAWSLRHRARGFWVRSHRLPYRVFEILRCSDVAPDLNCASGFAW